MKRSTGFRANNLYEVSPGCTVSPWWQDHVRIILSCGLSSIITMAFPHSVLAAIPQINSLASLIDRHCLTAILAGQFIGTLFNSVSTSALRGAFTLTGRVAPVRCQSFRVPALSSLERTTIRALHSMDRSVADLVDCNVSDRPNLVLGVSDMGHRIRQLFVPCQAYLGGFRFRKLKMGS